MIKYSSISHEDTRKHLNDDKTNKKGNAIKFLVYI